VPAFRVKLSASDLNCVDVPLNSTHSLTNLLLRLKNWLVKQKSKVVIVVDVDDAVAAGSTYITLVLAFNLVRPTSAQDLTEINFLTSLTLLRLSSVSHYVNISFFPVLSSIGHTSVVV